MEIKGISHPILKKYAERIYNDGKTVFISKICLTKASPGDKFIIYESRGSKAYTGWADIKSIGKQEKRTIAEKYGDKLMLTKKELYEYAKGKSEMNIIELENFIKFRKPVVPKHFVTVAGKYILEDEFINIDKNRG